MSNYVVQLIGMLLLLQLTVQCPQNCRVCQVSSICTVCENSYGVRVDGKCIKANINNCNIYNTQKSCSVCKSTFRPIGQRQTCSRDYTGCIRRSENQCQQCGFNTILLGSECRGVPNCLFYSINCQICSNGFELKDNKCYDTTSGCQQVSQQGSCLTCNQGYQLNGLLCIFQQSVTELNCQLFVGKQCRFCVLGYELKEKRCVAIVGVLPTPFPGEYKTYELLFVNSTVSMIKYSGNGRKLSDNCLQKTSDGRCSQCVDRYFLFENKCAPRLERCLQFNGQQCRVCKPYFEQQNGFCMDRYCLINQFFNCRVCVPYYRLIRNGICVQQYCLENQDGLCTKCDSEFLLDQNRTCIQIPRFCQQFDPFLKQCKQCLTDYTLNSENICLPTARCLKLRQNSTFCENCHPHFQNLNGTCADRNCKETNIESCVNCALGYFQTVNGICIDLYCNAIVNGSCIKCSKGFQLKEQVLICERIIEGCLEYNATSKTCDKCIEKWVKNQQGFCQNFNPEFLVTFDDETFKGDPNCAKYVNKECSQCNPGYIVLNKICVPVASICKTLSSKGSCSACIDGFILFSGQCFKSLNSQTTCDIFRTDTRVCGKCINRFYLSKQGICFKVSPLCSDYNQSTGVCTACYYANALIDGLCLPTDERCEKVQNAVCTKCKPFFMLESGSCVDVYCEKFEGLICVECKQGHVLNRTLCVDQNCEIAKDGFCERCKTTYQPNQKGLCLQPTQNNNKTNSTSPVQVQVQVKVLPNCQNQMGDRCLECKDGFELIQSSCQEISKFCIEFDQVLRKCLKCATGYFLRNDVCELANSAFIVEITPHCIKAVKGDCVECSDNYVLFKGSCYFAKQSEKAGVFQVSALNCLEFESSSQNCTKCYDQQFFDKEKCVPRNPNCKAFEAGANRCSQCFQGFILENGACTITIIVESTPSIPITDPSTVQNCAQVVGAACFKCSHRYYKLNNKCTAVDTSCKTYSETDGKCTSCYQGFTINPEGLCTIASSVTHPFCVDIVDGKCQRCESGYYVEKTREQCVELAYPCAKDQYEMKTGACLSCQEKFLLLDGKCLTPSAGFDLNCKNYDSVFCVECNEGFTLNQSNLCQKQ